MSAGDPILLEMASTGAGSDVFALTDEQIIGVEPETQAGADLEQADGTSRQDAGATKTRADGNAADGRLVDGAGEGLTPEGVSYRPQGTSDKPEGMSPKPEGASNGDAQAQEVPQWLAERMRDPSHGVEARELWDGKQRAEKEAAAYREVFATPAEARTLKEIYPGGVNEAKAAAERARTLDEIDAAFYRGDGAARAQLAQKMMQQDPAAFREMVEAGVRLLGTAGGQLVDGVGEGLTPEGVSYKPEGISGKPERIVGKGDGTSHRDGHGASANAAVAPEVVSAYRVFEKAANAELEKSVGGAIARMMEQALPNLKMMGANGREGAQGSAPLQERLAGAVREEIEAALKSDGQLGEQVGKILAGRRFDDGARAQVVRLIDTRAQQLVPGAVRRVVGSWTQATLGAHGTRRNPSEVEHEGLGETQRRAAAALVRKENERQVSGKNEKTGVARREAGTSRGRRVDYGKLSDEEILGM